MCLASHYRRQLTFSYNSLDTAESAYIKLKNKTRSLKYDDNYNDESYNKYNDAFKKALEDDLNTANALTVLYDLLKSDESNGTKYKLVSDFDKVLSLDLIDKGKKTLENEEQILNLIDLRDEAKKNKNYTEADRIREELLKQNIRLKDTKDGTIYEVIN